VAFAKVGGALFDAFKLLIGKIPSFPGAAGDLYHEENPFAWMIFFFPRLYC